MREARVLKKRVIMALNRKRGPHARDKRRSAMLDLRGEDRMSRTYRTRKRERDAERSARKESQAVENARQASLRTGIVDHPVLGRSKTILSLLGE